MKDRGQYAEVAFRHREKHLHFRDLEKFWVGEELCGKMGDDGVK